MIITALYNRNVPSNFNAVSSKTGRENTTNALINQYIDEKQPFPIEGKFISYGYTFFYKIIKIIYFIFITPVRFRAKSSFIIVKTQIIISFGKYIAFK